MKRVTASVLVMVLLLISCVMCGCDKRQDGNNKSGGGELEYVLNEDGESYSVVGIGSCTDTEIVIPHTYKNLPVTSIGDYAFGGAWLTCITIPDSVTSIGYAAFACCWSLQNVTIPNSVTNISAMAFQECYSLECITIPKSVTNIGVDAFRDCNFVSIIVESGNTVYHSDGNCLIETESKNLIKGCQNSVIPTNGSVTSIGNYAFSGCYTTKFFAVPDDSTESIVPDVVTSLTIPDSVTSIGDYAFLHCDTLTSITLPDNVTSIGYDAFSGCSGLTSITIPDSVSDIGSGAFSNCSNLISIMVGRENTAYHSYENCLIETETKFLIAGCANSVIPTDGSVTSIGTSAFSGCISLTSITIPDSVTSISDSAFYGCSSLTSVYYCGMESDWEGISIKLGNAHLTDATRYYYSETEPMEEGNYWHYNENGNPVAW